MSQDKLALVLGATGGIGGAVARELLAQGWTVRALNRDPAAARARSKADGMEWVGGDATVEADVVRAAAGAAVIVHAVNPPGYRNWDKLVLPMLDATIAAARAAGARIVLPGTVYNYGPDAFPRITETSPQHPVTRKGGIRVEMERRLREAAGTGVPGLIVRAGDFFGPRPGNSWFSQAVVKPGVPVTVIRQPVRPGIGHQWAYLPDVAQTITRLLAQAGRLGSFELFHMDGHWDPDGTALPGAIRRAVGAVPVKPFPWWALNLASPFVPTFREMREMHYLWRTPVRLDNARLVAFLGAEPHTPLDTAVRRTLQGLGCLPADEAAKARS